MAVLSLDRLMPLHRSPRILACAVLAASALGCSKSPAPSTPATAGTTYEVVTVERPESVENYHRMYKAMYDMCAETRVKVLKLPPPSPMKQPPADYISQRTTYVSDGKAYLVKQEHFAYKMDDADPTKNCDTYFESTSSTQMVRDGKVYDASFDNAGKRERSEPEEWILPREDKEHVYTEPKTVKGHAVKCMKMLPNTEQLITELCIADRKPGTLTDVSGEPIVLTSRVTSAQSVMSAMLTEPVSVRVGHAVDKAVFDAAAAP